MHFSIKFTSFVFGLYSHINSKNVTKCLAYQDTLKNTKNKPQKGDNMLQHINTQQYLENIKNGSSVVILGASWCPDCRRIEPILEVLAKEYEGKVEFYHISVDSEGTLKDILGVRAIPTLIGYKNGEEIGDRLVEPDSKTTIETLVKQTL